MTREQGVPSAGTRSCSGRVEAGRALCYAGRPMDSIKVEQLVKDRDFDLRLELLAGENGRDRRIVSARSQKPGLARSGFTEHIHTDQRQAFGNTEISYQPTQRRGEAH